MRKTQPSSVSVAVCVCTYRRPQGLRRLLASLSELSFRRIPPPDWRLIVVDNDAAETGRAVVAEMKKKFDIPLLYQVEPQRGISAARNRAVAASGAVEWIAFIDDDQIAEPTWLEELLITQQRFQADVVAGPVLPRFEQTPSAWIIKGGFFERPRHLTGQSVIYAGLGNMMIRAACLRYMDKPFDASLNLIGSEDTILLWRLREQGAKIVWCDEAMTYEYHPSSRLNLAYILDRNYHKGNATALRELMIKPNPRIITIRLAKGIGHIVVGLMALLPSLILRGKVGGAQCLVRIVMGLGNLSGLIGIRYEFYRKIHGQ